MATTRTYLGNGVALMLAVLAMIGLGVGHFFGGPLPGDRTAPRCQPHLAIRQARWPLRPPVRFVRGVLQLGDYRLAPLICRSSIPDSRQALNSSGALMNVDTTVIAGIRFRVRF